ncbi:MAG: tyrosine-type recombinase/integrase [Syntrophales bacterium]
MTLEEESFDGDLDYSGKQRVFNRIMRRIEEQALPGAPHVGQYFQDLHRRNVSIHTLKSAFTTIHSFLSFLQKHGKSNLSSLIQEDLEAFVESQQDRGLKPLSVKGNLRQVQTFLRYLITRGIVPSDVLARPIRIKVPDALPRAMDPVGVKRLLSVIQNIRNRAMILVLLRTGMRIGELLQTRVSDVHLDERKILLWVGEKNRTGRVVYLSEDACEALRAWNQKRDPHKPLLFYARGRSTMSYTRARMLFGKYLQKANLSHKGYSLHCLRHTCATQLLNAGMRLECLQQLLGHSTVEQTRRYARLTDKTREEEYFRAMARIEGRQSDERDGSSSEVPAVFEEAQLFNPYDQELHEYAATLSAVAARTG